MHAKRIEKKIMSAIVLLAAHIALYWIIFASSFWGKEVHTNKNLCYIYNDHDQSLL